MLHIALTIMKLARNERLQLQAARLVSDLSKQDLELTRMQLVAMSQSEGHDPPDDPFPESEELAALGAEQVQRLNEAMENLSQD